MTEDFLDWMAPSVPWSWDWHLHDPLTNACYCVLQPGQCWFPKNNPAQGFQGFDLNTFDENFIYQKLTESDWVNKDFKAFLGKGIPWCPRYFTPGAFNLPLVTAVSSYTQVKTCVAAPTPYPNVGTVVTQLSGPYPSTDPGAAFGGDLGNLAYCKVNYQWNYGGVLEEFFYAKPYGWVMWRTSNLVNNGYVVQKTSLFNKIVAGGFGPINFPCPIPA